MIHISGRPRGAGGRQFYARKAANGQNRQIAFKARVAEKPTKATKFNPSSIIGHVLVQILQLLSCCVIASDPGTSGRFDENEALIVIVKRKRAQRQKSKWLKSRAKARWFLDLAQSTPANWR
jgi:hypothetical protein